MTEITIEHLKGFIIGLIILFGIHQMIYFAFRAAASGWKAGMGKINNKIDIYIK